MLKTWKIVLKKFESLFVKYQGKFAKPVGEVRTKQYSYNTNQFSIEYTSQNSYTYLTFSEVNSKWVGIQRWRFVGADEID